MSTWLSRIVQEHFVIVETVGVTLSVALLAGYHAYLFLRLRRNPHYTIQALNRDARAAWVEHVMSHESKAILGVQTLRNSTMAATFLASTAILLIIGLLNIGDQVANFIEIWHIAGASDVRHSELWIAKMLLLVADFFVAFFCFSMTIRLLNHVGFQVSIPQQTRPTALTPAHVAVHLNRAGLYHSLGMRAYYTSVPLLFWLFGAHLLLLSTVVLIVVLYHLDRTPRDRGKDAELLP